MTIIKQNNLQEDSSKIKCTQVNKIHNVKISKQNKMHRSPGKIKCTRIFKQNNLHKDPGKIKCTVKHPEITNN